MSEHTIPYEPASNLLVYDRWLQDIGKTPATGGRWRKRGWIVTHNICGRVYVTRDEIALFGRRVMAGEFAKPHKTPNRKEATR